MEIEQLKKDYESKVKQIKIKLKSKYFIPDMKIDSSSIKIMAYDDMFYEMYFNRNGRDGFTQWAQLWRL